MNLVEKYKNSRIFKKEPRKKAFVLCALNWLCKPVIFWEWDDVGLVFRIFRNADIGDYLISIDIQILWFNLWLQCFKKFTPCDGCCLNGKMSGTCIVCEQTKYSHYKVK